MGLHLSYALEDLQGSYTYLGNENFNTEGQCVWQRRVWHNVLAIKGSANSPSTDGAVITFVGQISDSRYYLLPDAGYRNPTTFTKSLADAKGTATLLCPPLASFGAHWETTYNNVKKLATAIATPGNPFKGALDSDKSIKVTYRPFLVSVCRTVLFLTYLTHTLAYRRRIRSSAVVTVVSVASSSRCQTFGPCL